IWCVFEGFLGWRKLFRGSFGRFFSLISPIDVARPSLQARRCRSLLASESRLLCHVCLLAAVNFHVAIQPRLDSESIFAANFHYTCCRRYQGGHLSNKQFNYV